jgi:hypothetical protein
MAREWTVKVFLADNNVTSLFVIVTASSDIFHPSITVQDEINILLDSMMEVID